MLTSFSLQRQNNEKQRFTKQQEVWLFIFSCANVLPVPRDTPVRWMNVNSLVTGR